MVATQAEVRERLVKEAAVLAREQNPDGELSLPTERLHDGRHLDGFRPGPNDAKRLRRGRVVVLILPAGLFPCLPIGPTDRFALEASRFILKTISP